MPFELVVTQPFGSYAKGDVITAKADMDAALEASPHCVVRRATAAPAAPPATPSAPSSPAN